MFPSELVLKGQSHCYVSLPNAFVSRETKCKPGSVIGIRSVQNDDKQIFVLWDGKVTNDDKTYLDHNFAKANNLQDEMVVVSLAADPMSIPECPLCRVELLKATDRSIVAENLSANVLDRCRLVAKDLVIPIWLSEHVHVLAKVIAIEPIGANFVQLTHLTEMQITYDILDKHDDPASISEIEPVKEETFFVSYALGLKEQKPKFFPGVMLVEGERGSGKTHLLKTIAKNYTGYPTELYNCKQLRGKRPESIRKTLNELLAKCLEKQPSILALDDVDSFLSIDTKQHEDKGQDAIYRARLVNSFYQFIKRLERSESSALPRIAILATCQNYDELDPQLIKSVGRKYFTFCEKLLGPNLERRTTILGNILQMNQLNTDVSDLEIVAKKCKSYMPADLRRLVERSIMFACARSRSEFSSEPLIVSLDDFMLALNGYTPTNMRSVSLESKSLKNLDDVGGLSDIKTILKKTILLPIKYPKLFGKCAQRMQTSVLLYGPPGCGKSLLAEAISNQDGLNAIFIRGPELLSKYIGGSEAAVRNLFKRASSARPCVVVFDEFESLVPKRGSDSTGVTDRVVNQFLTLVDGVETMTSDVYIVATTSRPDMIDPAILRPGRIERHIYCPLPNKEDRLDILRVLVRKLKLKDFNDTDWSEKLVNFTGADIQSWLYSAQVGALHDQLDKEGKQDRDFEIIVEPKHLEFAFEKVAAEVRDKNSTLEKRYPKSFRITNNQFVARATLA